MSTEDGLAPARPGLQADLWRRFVLKRSAWEAVGVLVVLGVALAVRVARLGTVPSNLTADEAEFFQNVYQILAGKGPGFFGFDWTPSPALGVYIMTGTVKLFGSSMVGIRMSSVLLSMGTLILFFLLAKQYLSYWASLLATLLLATNLWFLHFSRTAWSNMNGDLFAVGGALMLTLAIRRQYWLYYAAAGAFAALGVYGYFSARLLLLFFLAYLPFALLFGKGQRKPVVRGYAVLALAFAVVLMPQAKSIAGNWDRFNSRSNTTFILHQKKPYLGEVNTAKIVLRQVKWSAQAFILTDSGSLLQHGLWSRYIPRDRGPLNTLCRVLFFGGLVAAAWKWKDTALWWIMFLGPVFTIQVFSAGTPDLARGLIVAPFMFLFIGLALEYLLKAARLAASRFRWSYATAAVALAAVVSLSAVTETRAYFDWMSQPYALNAREPAVTGAEFPEWQRLLTQSIAAGQGSFSAGDWRTRQDANGCALGTVPKVLCQGVSQTPSAIATPGPGQTAATPTEAPATSLPTPSSAAERDLSPTH